MRLLINQATTKFLEMTRESVASAVTLAEQALNIDRTNPRAARTLSVAVSACMSMGVLPRSKENIDRALSFGEQAVRAVPDDEYARCVLAWALSAAGRHAEAVNQLTHAVEINPTYPGSHCDLAEQYAILGESDRALESVNASFRLTAHNPSDYWRHHVVAVAQFSAGRDAEALEAARKVVRAKPGYVKGALYWAAAAAAAGQGDEASRAIAHCLAEMPELRLSNVCPGFVTRYARDHDHQRFLEMLRKAGLPG